MGLFREVSQDLEVAGGKGIQRNAGNTAFEAVYTNPDYFKYQIVTSVSSGNLTVALKNYLGTDPSATTPVKIQIGDTIRTITSARSITKNAGTNYLNLGSAELATKEVELFCYLRWDTGSLRVELDVSRIPFATKTGDFVQNDTNEKGYWVSAFAGSPTTDIEVNIGRFNAILSAGAGYTWSIPATSEIKNYPIFESRVLESNANAQGFSSMTTNTLKYKVVGNTVKILGPNSIEGTSNATTFSFSLPFSTSAYIRNGLRPVFVKDNNTNQSVIGHLDQDNGSGGSIIKAYKSFYGGVWTNTGTKAIYINQFDYDI